MSNLDLDLRPEGSDNMINHNLDNTFVPSHFVKRLIITSYLSNLGLSKPEPELRIRVHCI